MMKTPCTPVLVACLSLGAALSTNAAILNPSFEEAGSPLLHWSSVDADYIKTSRDVTSINGLPTDGVLAGRIFRYANNSFAIGDNASLSQEVDLTGVDSILFDASLDLYNSGTETNSWSPEFEAQFLIDGSPHWSQSASGGFLNQSVDTTALSGNHTIEFRLIAVAEVVDDLAGSDWFTFDNLRSASIPEPSTVALFSLVGCCVMTVRLRSRFDRVGYCSNPPFTKE